MSRVDDRPADRPPTLADYVNLSCESSHLVSHNVIRVQLAKVGQQGQELGLRVPNGELWDVDDSKQTAGQPLTLYPESFLWQGLFSR